MLRLSLSIGSDVNGGSSGPALGPIITATTSPTLSALDETETPADGYTAGIYVSSAGAVVSDVPTYLVNGNPEAANYDLQTNDVLSINILVTDDANNTRIFSVGPITVSSVVIHPIDQIPGLAGWFDADLASSIQDTGGAVSLWDGRSQAANSAVQATPSLQPATDVRTINGLNAVDFTPVQMLTLTDAISRTDGYTVFAVVQLDDLSSNRPVFGSPAGGFTLRISSSGSVNVVRTSQAVLLSTASGVVTVGTPTLIAIRTGSAGSDAYASGALPVSNAVNAMYTQDITEVGQSQSIRLNGAIGELPIYSRILSNAEMDVVGNYLAAKWGVSWANIAVSAPVNTTPPDIELANTTTPLLAAVPGIYDNGPIISRSYRWVDNVTDVSVDPTYLPDPLLGQYGQTITVEETVTNASGSVAIFSSQFIVPNVPDVMTAGGWTLTPAQGGATLTISVAADARRAPLQKTYYTEDDGALINTGFTDGTGTLFIPLPFGEPHSIEIYNDNQYGISTGGTASTKSVTSTAVVPATMAAPDAVSTGPNSFSVTRAATPADGGASIEEYKLRYRTGAGLWTTIAPMLSPQAVSGVLPATVYEVQNLARNGVGDALWSLSDTVTTDAANPAAVIDSVSVGALVGNDLPVDLTATGAAASGIYWVMVPAGQGEPSASQIRAGQNSSGGSPLSANDFMFVYGSVINSSVADGINENVDLHVVADNGTLSNVASALNFNVNTVATTFPSVIDSILGGNSTANGTTFAGPAFTPSAGSNRVLMLMAAFVSGGTAPTAATATFGAQPMTPLAFTLVSTYSAGVAMLEIREADIPAGSSIPQIIFDQSVNGCVFESWVVQDVPQATPFGAPVLASTNSLLTQFNAAGTSTAANSLIAAVVGFKGGGIPMSVTGGTEVNEAETGTGNSDIGAISAQLQQAAAGAYDIVADKSGAGNKAASVSVEILAL